MYCHPLCQACIMYFIYIHSGMQSTGWRCWTGVSCILTERCFFSGKGDDVSTHTWRAVGENNLLLLLIKPELVIDILAKNSPLICKAGIKHFRREISYFYFCSWLKVTYCSDQGMLVNLQHQMESFGRWESVVSQKDVYIINICMIVCVFTAVKAWL